MQPSSSPTRMRFRILFLACTLAMLTYLDRVCYGAAGKDVVASLGLNSEADLKWTFTAFAIAYGIFEIPCGWWGDRFGARSVMLRIVVWWSVFTMLTGCVGLQVGGMVFGGLITLIVIRFLFGIGEAGAFPILTRVIHNWFPAQSRATAMGWVWMAARLMGGLTPVVWTLLVTGTSYSPSLMSWRAAFWLFGLLGIIWCIAFAKWFRNRPEDHPGVNQAERELIAAQGSKPIDEAGMPWRRILTDRSLVCLYVMYFCVAYAWYFNITYLPSCLETWHGVKKDSVIGSFYKGGPLIIGALGCVLGGYLTDAMLRRGVRRRLTRCIPGFFGVGLSAMCYFFAGSMTVAWSFALAIAMAAFFNDLMMSSAWATCQDIGGRASATVSGVMNTFASAGTALAGWFTGYVLDLHLDAKATELNTTVKMLSEEAKTAALSAGYQVNLWIFGCIASVGAIMWLGVNPERKLEV